MKLIPELRDIAGKFLRLDEIVVEVASEWIDGGQRVSIWLDQWSYDNDMERHTEAWVPSWWTLA